MPHETDNLIALLLLEAGAIMEDASPEFARAWPRGKAGQAERIARLTDIAQTFSALAGAARQLHSRVNEKGYDNS